MPFELAHFERAPRAESLGGWYIYHGSGRVSVNHDYYIRAELTSISFDAVHRFLIAVWVGRNRRVDEIPLFTFLLEKWLNAAEQKQSRLGDQVAQTIAVVCTIVNTYGDLVVSMPLYNMKKKTILNSQRS